MKKNPVYCTGDPETCETCISIKEFIDRLQKNKTEKTSILLPMPFIEKNRIMRDK